MPHTSKVPKSTFRVLSTAV